MSGAFSGHEQGTTYPGIGLGGLLSVSGTVASGVMRVVGGFRARDRAEQHAEMIEFMGRENLRGLRHRAMFLQGEQVVAATGGNRNPFTGSAFDLIEQAAFLEGRAQDHLRINTAYAAERARLHGQSAAIQGVGMGAASIVSAAGHFLDVPDTDPTTDASDIPTQPESTTLGAGPAPMFWKSGRQPGIRPNTQDRMAAGAFF